MKKSLLFFMSSFIAITMFGQWQGFENWTNNSVLFLDNYQTSVNDWGTEGANATFRSTDAFVGTYSIRLENILSSYGDTLFGYFIDGDPDNMTPGQQVTLPAVDSITGYYKYDILPGDSVLFLAMTTFNSVPTGGGNFYFKGQQTTWKRFSFAVNALAADSLLLGAACGDPINNFNGKPGSWIQFDNIQLKDGSQIQNVMNHSFENWTAFNWEDPSGWFTGNFWGVGEPTLPCNKTTDKHAGTYAIDLSILISTQGDTLWGAATNGYFDYGGPKGGEPFSGTPVAVECYYKYAPVSGDQANISIEFRQNGTVVGNYGTSVNTTVASYTLWNQSVPAMTPDTVLITLWAGNKPGSQLKVDNIDFLFPVGVANGLKVEKVISYPNPTTDELNIKFSIENNNNVVINLIDITGKTLATRNLGNLSSGTYRERFNTSNYSSGVYFIEFNLGNEKITKRFIIK